MVKFPDLLGPFWTSRGNPVRRSASSSPLRLGSRGLSHPGQRQACGSAGRNAAALRLTSVPCAGVSREADMGSRGLFFSLRLNAGALSRCGAEPFGFK